MSDILEIDGSTLEGGGQILRMSLAFSVLLKKPIRVFNIRSGRSTPGLRPQHLAGVNLVRDLCNGRLVGNAVGSTEITFHPNDIKCGKYSADPGTAGSIMLLFQVSLPCLLYGRGPSELVLKGGTNVDMAPQIDHTLMVFKPVVEKMGIKFSCDIIKRGYYPKGGGEIRVKVSPPSLPLQPIELIDRGSLVTILGKAFVAGVLPVKMSHAMADGAMQCLQKQYPTAQIKIERIKEPSHLAEGNGSGIVIVAKTDSGCLFGGSALGKRGVQASEVGEKAAEEIVADTKSEACVDRYVQDQLIIFMALAKGVSRIKIGKPTLHTETAIHIAQLMTEAKFTIAKDESGLNSTIQCEGIGLN